MSSPWQARWRERENRYSMMNDLNRKCIVSLGDAKSLSHVKQFYCSGKIHCKVWCLVLTSLMSWFPSTTPLIITPENIWGGGTPWSRVMWAGPVESHGQQKVKLFTLPSINVVLDNSLPHFQANSCTATTLNWRVVTGMTYKYTTIRRDTAILNLY